MNKIFELAKSLEVSSIIKSLPKKREGDLIRGSVCPSFYSSYNKELGRRGHYSTDFVTRKRLNVLKGRIIGYFLKRKNISTDINVLRCRFDDEIEHDNKFLGKFAGELAFEEMLKDRLMRRVTSYEESGTGGYKLNDDSYALNEILIKAMKLPVKDGVALLTKLGKDR